MKPNREFRLLTIRQVAEQLGLSPRTVSRLIKRGELTAIRLGRSVRIHPSELESLIRRYRDT